VHVLLRSASRSRLAQDRRVAWEFSAGGITVEGIGGWRQIAAAATVLSSMLLRDLDVGMALLAARIAAAAIYPSSRVAIGVESVISRHSLLTYYCHCHPVHDALAQANVPDVPDAASDSLNAIQMPVLKHSSFPARKQATGVRRAAPVIRAGDLASTDRQVVVSTVVPLVRTHHEGHPKSTSFPVVETCTFTTSASAAASGTSTEALVRNIDR
jgi:hypothetical protein